MAARKPPSKKKKRLSPVEDQFAKQIKKAGIPAAEREYVFDDPQDGRRKRRWRFDFAWVGERLAAEVEGGVWSGGRHVNPAGFEKDCEKYAEALAQGWTVLRVTSKQVKNGSAIAFLERIWLARRAQ